MWADVELRELKVFLALAEELHFARTAERVQLTPSRVSQVLRDLEEKLGGELFNRNTRRVTLSPLGESLRTDARPHYDALLAALERAHGASRRLAGRLRLGLLAANSGGPHLTKIINEFERLHPECELAVIEIFFSDPLGPLRRGEIDILATPLPIEQPDITVGPTLAREKMVLAVANDHPLADRQLVSLEDIADYPIAPITESPREMVDAMFPRTTPSGRKIRRLVPRPKTPHEVTALIVRGKIVHPTVPSFAQYFGQPGITYIPITDMAPRKSGLVWRRRTSDPRLREFVGVAREIIAATRRAPRD